jgi:hypothetical protein
MQFAICNLPRKITIICSVHGRDLCTIDKRVHTDRHRIVKCKCSNFGRCCSGQDAKRAALQLRFPTGHQRDTIASKLLELHAAVGAALDEFELELL